MLVVVHGPPGSGKSTLARKLGTELHLPVFDRDDFMDALFETLGWSDRDWSTRVGMASWDLMRLCVEPLVRTGMSLIAESNFRPADSLVADLRSLCAEAEAVSVEIYCTAPPEVLWDRFDGRRQAGGRHAGHVGFEDREVFLADLQARPHGPLDLGGSLITLDTTNTWPEAADVAEQIRTLAHFTTA